MTRPPRTSSRPPVVRVLASVTAVGALVGAIAWSASAWPDTPPDDPGRSAQVQEPTSVLTRGQADPSATSSPDVDAVTGSGPRGVPEPTAPPTSTDRASAPSDSGTAAPATPTGTADPSGDAAATPRVADTDEAGTEVEDEAQVEEALDAVVAPPELPDLLAGSAEQVEAAEQELSAISTGPMYAELEAELLELESQGWTREGSPVVSDVTPEEGEDPAVPGSLLVSACVDWSAVRFFESDGSPIAANPTPRAKQLYTLVRGDDDRWVVYSRDLPADPRC